jgi:hypothetical protein
MKGPVRAGPNRRRETSDFGGRLSPFTGMSHLGVPRQIALTIAFFRQIVISNVKFSLTQVPANGVASASSGNIPPSLHVSTVASHPLHDGAPFMDGVLLHRECDDGRELND